MKKLLSLILMLSVTLLPVSALAASGDAILLRQGEDGYNSSVFSIAEVDGDLYALTYDGLYVFASGETKPVHYDFPISSAVDDGDDDEDTAVSRSVSALMAGLMVSSLSMAIEPAAMAARAVPSRFVPSR